MLSIVFLIIIALVIVTLLFGFGTMQSGIDEENFTTEVTIEDLEDN